MQLEDRPLELEESELFDEEEDMRPAGGPPSSQLHALGGAAGAHPNQAGESDSDDDGIVLELESDCSSSDAEDAVEEELASRIESLQSSLENAAPVQDQALGTSHSSQVGSLKSFGGVSFKGKRLFGSEGDLATSMPVRSTAPMVAGRRKVAPVTNKQTCNLGTSMPISIPMMQRRSSSTDLLEAGEGAPRGQRAAAATFVPPHMLHRQESAEFGGLIPAPGAELGLSPSASAKREKLLARNAILRSTGFIEVQHPPVIGEVLDPVKDQLLAGAADSAAGAVAVPAARPDPRATPRSSLTQLLGTSK